MTPIIRQYLRIKQDHPDKLVFYRCGDFYNLFFDDAKRAVELFGIVLTKRCTDGEPIPMAGITAHVMRNCVRRMTDLGISFVICEPKHPPGTTVNGKLVKLELEIKTFTFTRETSQEFPIE